MQEIILIIDDDEDDIKNFRDHITELQTEYVIESEKEFSKAIEKIKDIRNQGKKVVAVFIDLIKKEGDFKEIGLNTISAVKEQLNDILVVAYTQYDKDYAQPAQDRGADWFFRKQNLKTLTLRDIKNHIEKHEKEHNIEHTHHKDWFVDILLKILNGIHNSIARITDSKNRHAKRNNTFKIEDEYDLQDLVWTILKPIFPEMVDEVPLPKHMAKSSRADFYIPEIKTILELKYIKSEDYAKGIPEQLDNDITWYGELSQAENLIFYVLKGDKIAFPFDPTIKKLNADNFLRDSKTWKSLKCIVRPQ